MNMDVSSAFGRLAQTIDSIIHYQAAHLLHYYTASIALYDLALL